MLLMPMAPRNINQMFGLTTLVTKVQFNTTAARPKATGVEFIVGKSLYRADPRSKNVDGSTGTYGSVIATKEIIISGGTFNTPQIIQLSGVGPAAELKKFDIPVIKDLPGVGTNMQDRYEVGIVGNSTSDFALLKDCTFLNGTDPCLEQWEDVPLLKGGYSTNGIALAYFKHSSVADRVQDLFLGGVTAYLMDISSAIPYTPSRNEISGLGSRIELNPYQCISYPQTYKHTP